MDSLNQSFYKPLGLELLRECSTVGVERQVDCYNNSTYSVFSHQGILFKTSNDTAAPRKNKVVITNNKNQLFASPFTVVHLTMHLPVSVVPKSGLSSSLLILDEFHTPKLKIRPQGVMSKNYTILGSEDTTIGTMKREWGGDWVINFPPDLDLRFKAAVIAACIYYNKRKFLIGR